MTPSRPGHLDIATLLDAVVAVSSDLDLDLVLGRIARAACQLVGATTGAVGIADRSGEGLVGFVTEGISPEQRAAVGIEPRGHGVLALPLTRGKPVRIADVAAHPAARGFPPKHPHITTLLAVPIHVRGLAFGALYLADKVGAQEFSQEDEDVVVALAAATGVAIENARLYETAERQRRWSDAITGVSRALLRGERPTVALDEMARAAVDVAEASMAVIGLCDGGISPPVVGSVVGPDPGACAEMIGSLMGSPHWIEALAARRPLLLVSRAEEDRDEPPAGALRVGTGLDRHGATAIAPIVAGDTAYGLLVVGWPSGAEKAASDNIESLARYAAQAGLTLAAANAQRDRARASILEDRDRIARDMHDLVIQRLYAVGLSLQGTGHLATDERVIARIDAAVDEVDRAIKELRSTIYALHRAKDVGQAIAEVTEVMHGFLPTLGLVPTLDVVGDLDDVPEALHFDVVAVVREALANVVRHAQAKAVDVVIAVSDGQVSVRVRDDGVGVPASGVRRSGLGNLDERARRHGGSLSLTRRAGGGTALDWSAPLG